MPVATFDDIAPEAGGAPDAATPAAPASPSRAATFDDIPEEGGNELDVGSAFSRGVVGVDNPDYEYFNVLPIARHKEGGYALTAPLAPVVRGAIEFGHRAFEPYQQSLRPTSPDELAAAGLGLRMGVPGMRAIQPTRPVEPGVPIPEGLFQTPRAAPPEPAPPAPPAPRAPAPEPPPAGGGGGGVTAVEPPAPTPRIPEPGPVEEVPVVQPDGSVVLEQVIRQTQEQAPAVETVPSPAGEPPAQVVPEPAPAAPVAVVPPPPPPPPPVRLPRSPATIMQEDGIGGPQAIRKANAERAAYLALTGQEPPRDRRGELEAILADPRSNEEIQAEMDAEKLAALQQATDALPNGFSITRAGDDWVLTDPAGVEQMRVTGRLPGVETSAEMGQVAAGLAGKFDYSAFTRVGEGTRDSPIVPHQPADMAAAVDRVAEPTPAQAEAGNYRKGHVDIGGLQISIENPAGSERSGVGPDGTSWSVTMPADYGYVKRTEGADGDQVDVYLGPDAHQAENLPVYVVDQKDAHSWGFDEHKAMLGFPSQEAAVNAYRAGFSDGYGPQRMGAITPMTFQQFREWLRNGDTAQPLAYTPPAILTPQQRRAIYNRPLSLLEFLAASGGIREERGELEYMGLTKKFIPKLGRLVRESGMSHDRAREAAQEAGYLPAESANGPPQIGVSDLLNLMAEEAAGRKIFTPEDEADMLASAQAREQDEEKERFEEARSDVADMAAANDMILTPAQIEEAAIAVMGGRDTRDALYDVAVHAALEADAAAAESARAGSAWDVPFDWEIDPNVQSGEFPGVTAAAEGGEPAGPGRVAEGEPPAGGVQPESRDGAVQAPAGGGTEAVPRHGQQPGTTQEPEFGFLSPVTDRERAEARGERPLQGGAASPGGIFEAATGAQTDLVDAVRAARNFGSIAAPNVPALAEEFAQRFLAGERFATIQQARKLASTLLDGPVQAGTTAAKAVDEAVELGAVLAARQIVAQGDDQDAVYARIVQLYDEQQPKLSVRTSDSVERQAYSTPLPLAYVASRLAGVAQAGSVIEPTAGNGALLIEAKPARTSANEIDPERFANLRAQGFAPTQFNAAQVPQQARAFDTLITNPPFGVVKDDAGNTVRYPLDFIQPGYDTGEIDHAISLFSLETLKDDGTAVLILGGLNKLLRTPRARADGYNAKAKREFFYTLYGHYNVVDHFTVAGELYERQGAGWPVDVVVIRGRGKSSLPLPSIAAPRVIGSWSALKEVLDVAEHGAGPRPGETVAAAGDAGGVGRALEPGGVEHPAPQERPEGRQPVDERLPRDTGGQGRVADREGAGAGSGAAGDGGRAGEPGRVERPEPVREPSGRGAADAGGQSGVPGPVPSSGRPAEEPMASAPDTGGREGRAGNEPGGLDRGRAGEPERQPGGVEPSPRKHDFLEAEKQPSEEKIAREIAAPSPDLQGEPTAKPKRRKEEIPSTPQVPYEPKSKAKPVGTLVPTNLRTAAQEALQNLADRVGDIDAFVAEKLGYKPDELSKYFSAEQVDAIALGINNIDRDQGFVIGDQTGVGKGRFVAAMIRYADRKGLTPVFVTEKPNLYIDMVRDLTDIGMADFVDAILPTNSGLRLPLTDDPNGPVLRTADGKKQEQLLAEAANTRKLPEGKRALFTTYSQQQQIKEADTTRMRLLRSLAPNAFVILDEAHNAGGSGASEREPKNGKVTRSKHFREVVGAARSVAYSSATWAKRPDVLDLYGAKTAMREAVDNLEQLAEAVKSGGVPMQQIITAQLAAVGQYARRERSFDGVTYELRPVEVDRAAYDEIAGILADIFRVSEDYAGPAVKEISKEIRAEAKSMSQDGAVGNAGATSTGFGAIMHNLINQMLLASKAQGTVDRALAKLEEGKKPVIALANTMGSFIAEFAEQTGALPGQPIDLTFNNLLNRYLERTLRYTTRKPFSKDKAEVHWLKPSELGSVGEALYRRTEARIKRIELGNLPVSPIDYIRAELTRRGYKVAEITGRTEAADYRADGKVYYRTRSERELNTKGRLDAIRSFNRGETDVMILNQSGATGLSLHASEKNPKAGRAKRAMLIAQAENNIDTHMQMLGRVHRTGQVIAPEYEQLVANVPAENRPAAVLAAKMASLTASTTSARKNVLTADTTPDFMNKYGGEVILQILVEDAELDRALGYLSRTIDDEGGGDLEALARRATGRIPLLPLAQQEEVYKRIEDRYRKLLADKDAAGENALEAKTLDLDAKPLESKTLVEAKGDPDNPFAAAANLERMDVKRTTKPPQPHQVVQMLAGELDVSKTLPPNAELEKESQDALAQRIDRLSSGEGEQKLQKSLADIEQAAEAERKKADDVFKDDDARRRQLDKVEANRARLAAVVRLAQPGDVVTITPAGELLPQTAMVIGLHKSGKNAVAPSAWDITILMEDGIRRTIPGSQLYTEENRPQSSPPEGARVLSSSGARAVDFLRNIAEHGAKGREERWIITGNILAGYAKKHGQIVNFTDAEGDVRQGVMLARDFDAAKFLSSQAQPMRGELGTAFLQQRYGDTPPYLTSSDGTLRIARDTSGAYIITVPQSKKQGAAFYLDKPLQRALGSNTFVSSGGQMRARFLGGELPDVMEAIEGVLKDEGTYLVSDHPEAKKFAEGLRTRASTVPGWGEIETQPETISPAAFDVLAQSVAEMTGNRTHIRFVDGEIKLTRGDTTVQAYGFSSGGILIRVALSTPSGTRWVLHHEAVHALRSFGLIEPAEWRVLERAADQGWLELYRIRDHYAGLPEDVQREEAVAEAFADFMSERKPPPSGMIGRAVQRTTRFLERLRSGLTGKGFTRPEDVFERVASGSVGKRKAKPVAGRVTDDLAEAEKNAIVNGFTYHPREMAQTLLGLAQTGVVDREIAPEVAKTFAALAAPGGPPQQQAQPKTIATAGGVATTVITRLTNLERIIGEMMEPRIHPSPMAHPSATDEARNLAKAYANSRRKVRWAGNRLMDDIEKRFTPDQRSRMWDAADAESVAQQTGNSPTGVGLDTLSAEERAEVERLQQLAGVVFRQARAVGIHDSDALPSYVPRMVVNIGMQDDRTHVVRDIRTLPLAIMRLQEAIIGKQLINQIKEIGQRTGAPTVRDAGGGPMIRNPMNPVHGIRVSTPQMIHREHLTTEETEAAARQIPDDPDNLGWFTIPESNAFWRWEWAGKSNETGEDRFRKVPIEVRKDFEGPLRAVLRRPDGKIYRFFIDLKGRMMTAIMYGVAHLGVIAGRAVAYSPNVIGLMREGMVARQDVDVMSRAIDHGLVPIGRQYGFQDAEGLDPERDLKPGRSWTAQLLAAIPSAVSRRAGDAVKRGVDVAGDVLHNKLLWDRVADIQAGSFVKFERDLIARGTGPYEAAEMAAHFANRVAGALPQEAMSQWATKLANIVLFSRSYRIGNAGMIKDAILGLPRDVQARMQKALGPDGSRYANSRARRFAIAVLLLDFALLQIGNSLIESSLNVIRGDRTIAQEARSYADRVVKEIEHLKDLGPIEGAIAAANLFGVMQSLTPMAEHEPGKENRILIGYEKDGSAVYLRNPLGKAIEDVADYIQRPLHTLGAMLSPYARAAAGLANEDGFGRPIWDPYAETPLEILQALGDYVGYVFESSTPKTAIEAGRRMVEGGGRHGAASDAAQIVGGGLGLSLSHGYPGGPGRGEAHRLQQEHEFQVGRAMPKIGELVRQGKLKEASDIMTKLGMLSRQQMRVIAQAKQPHTTPKQVLDIMRYAPQRDVDIMLQRFREQQQRSTGQSVRQ